MPYIRNGRPVRIPLEDNTNIFEGVDIKEIATMCHIQASKVTASACHEHLSDWNRHAIARSPFEP